MTKRHSKKLTWALMIVGAFFIILSVFVVVFFQVMKSHYGEKAKDITEQMLSLMPQVSKGIVDDRINVEMSVLEINGENYVGILEVPQYEAKLPICSKWSKLDVIKCPCRYTGSIYDGSLIIGGSDNEGQLDFFYNISINDSVYVTDVMGIRYTYTVTEIELSKDVSTEKLTSFDADLVLFARDTYGSDYTVVVCKFKNEIK